MWYNEPTILVFILALVTLILIAYASIQHSRRQAEVLVKPNDADEPLWKTITQESRPQVVVNIPPDFKPIQPLPGDTSLDGQKALLWYSVFKEALDQMHDGEWATSSQVDRACEVANAAVEACYGANSTGLPNT